MGASIRPIPATLGGRVAECRDRLGWTQKTLAENAGLSITFISEIENDHRTPGAEALLGIAEALGVSLDYLVKGLPEADPQPRPLVIPAELAKAAEERGWSVGRVSDLIKIRQMVVARRTVAGQSETPDYTLSTNDWVALYARYFDPDPNG